MIFYTVSDTNLRNWTRSATDCLNNHCNCNKCRLKDIVFNCRMKTNVLELYKKFGRPDNYEEPTIIEEE